MDIKDAEYQEWFNAPHNNKFKIMEKVNKYTRASKYDGKAIYCPKCNASNKVYHFCWSAITCGECKEMINKTEWNLKKQLI